MGRLIRRFLDWFTGAKPPCEHDWRPCVAQLVAWNESKPARQCLWCKEWQPLTSEQFYAQFGEHFYVAAKRNG